MVLIIQLNKSYTNATFGLLVYNNESHILGKAARIMVEMEENSRVFEFLNRYNVPSITITTAPEAQFMNQYNKWVFDTNFAKQITNQLITLKHHSVDIFNSAISALVQENI